MWLFKNQRVALVLALCLAAAAPAAAKTVYSWVTESGAQAYTDDMKRIPASYRASAVRRNIGPLTQYERYTPVVTVLDGDRLAKRLAELRYQEPGEAAPDSMYPIQQQGKMISVQMGGGRYGGGQQLILPLPNDSDGLVTVENVRTKPADSMATRHVTVVKQGDKVIALIKDERNQSPGPDGIPEQDLLE